jgi:hypothetical protein
MLSATFQINEADPRFLILLAFFASPGFARPSVSPVAVTRSAAGLSSTQNANARLSATYV